MLTFPASLPESGWTDQADFFLIGMGIFDTLNILGTCIFIFGYFILKEWISGVALINLTAMISSAIFFVLGTFAPGAWFNNPFEYISIAILFMPVIVLFISFIRHFFN